MPSPRQARCGLLDWYNLVPRPHASILWRCQSKQSVHPAITRNSTACSQGPIGQTTDAKTRLLVPEEPPTSKNPSRNRTNISLFDVKGPHLHRLDISVWNDNQADFRHADCRIHKRHNDLFNALFQDGHGPGYEALRTRKNFSDANP